MKGLKHLFQKNGNVRMPEIILQDRLVAQVKYPVEQLLVKTISPYGTKIATRAAICALAQLELEKKWNIAVGMEYAREFAQILILLLHSKHVRM